MFDSQKGFDHGYEEYTEILESCEDEHDLESMLADGADIYSAAIECYEMETEDDFDDDNDKAIEYINEYISGAKKAIEELI